MPTLAGNKQPFHPSLSSWDAPFPSFDRKRTVPIHQRWISKCLSPRRRFYLQFYKINSQMKEEKYFLSWEQWSKNKKYRIHDFK